MSLLIRKTDLPMAGASFHTPVDESSKARRLGNRENLGMAFAVGKGRGSLSGGGDPEARKIIDHVKKDAWNRSNNLLFWLSNISTSSLVSYLDSKDEKDREAAMFLLGIRYRYAPLEILPYLINALEDDKSESVRITAANALSNLYLEGEREDERIEGSKQAKEKAELVLVEALNDKSASVRIAAIRSLGKIGFGKKTESALIEAFGDKERNVRLSAAAEIAMKGKAIVPGLIKLLGNSDKNVREAAVSALESMGEEVEPAKNKLGEALIDKKLPLSTRLKAANVLAKIGEPAMPILIEALVNSDKENKGQVEYALLGTGKPGVRALVELLRGEDKRIQQLAKGTLEKLADYLRQSGGAGSAILSLELNSFKNDRNNLVREVVRGILQKSGMLS